jgi:hemoglobin
MTINTWRKSFTCVVLSLALLGGAGRAPAASRLYDQLGGEQGVAALVDQFLFNLADDKRINHFFVETNLKRFRAKLIEQFCALSGGPCTYSGDSMQQSHAGMGINHAAFNALVEDLIEAMEHLSIATGAQNRLLALLAPMHKDIIEQP